MPSMTLAMYLIYGMPYQTPQKRQRASRACDFCHTRGLRCRRGPESPSQIYESRAGCLTCRDYEIECTMNRPIRKRGRKPAAPEPGERGSDQSTQHDTGFPFLSEKDLETRWQDGIPDSNGPSYVLLMAVCAVSSQMAAMSAVFDSSLLQGLSIPDSEFYFIQAVSKIPIHIPQSQDFDYLRSFGLLAVYSLRRGNHRDLHRYLGLYHASVAQNGFHDEGRWPNNITKAEVDDRRRLFWCAYRLEVHSACVMGHVVRLPESQISVLYPRITPAMDPETQAWTAGWDYITDLFRLLEYAIFSLHGCKNRKPLLAVLYNKPSPMTLLNSLIQLKGSKPSILIGSTDPHDSFQSNRCRYMHVQTICTETLVHIMALLYCQASAHEVMALAESFLEEVTKAPLILFKVASSEIVHQLLGVGHMVRNASRFDKGQYGTEAKRIITFLGDLVKNLEREIPSAAEAAKRLLALAETTS
ncbi:hypothetical protein LZ31DRAFT_570469 [Colletotrichum somersetense]|nr:hypothetical protein LZ31DRAFT_570469 [Colletotrichum somersetense]